MTYLCRRALKRSSSSGKWKALQIILAFLVERFPLLQHNKERNWAKKIGKDTQGGYEITVTFPIKRVDQKYPDVANHKFFTH